MILPSLHSIVVLSVISAAGTSAVSEARVGASGTFSATEAQLLAVLHDHIIEQDWVMDYWEQDRGLLEVVTQPRNIPMFKVRDRWFLTVRDGELRSRVQRETEVTHRGTTEWVPVALASSKGPLAAEKELIARIAARLPGQLLARVHRR